MSADDFKISSALIFNICFFQYLRILSCRENRTQYFRDNGVFLFPESVEECSTRAVLQICHRYGSHSRLGTLVA